MEFLVVIFVIGIFCVYSARAQDFQPNIWSIDSGGKIDDVSGVTFFHSNPPQDGSPGLSMWDIGSKKQTDPQENPFSMFSNALGGNNVNVGVNQGTIENIKPTGFPLGSLSSATTVAANKNRAFEKRTLFPTGGEPDIPIVSMKDNDQLNPVQSETFFNFSVGIGSKTNTSEQNIAKDVFDLSQFGIKDGEVSGQSKTNSDMADTFQNMLVYNEGQSESSVNEAGLGDKVDYPFGSSKTLEKERKSSISQKGPSMRVVSGFQDHAMKPVLRSKGKFIDFTERKVPDPDNSLDHSKMDNRVTDLNESPRLTGIGLPGVIQTDNAESKLAPIQLKPFKPHVAEVVTTLPVTIISTSPSTFSDTDTNMNILQTANAGLLNLESNNTLTNVRSPDRNDIPNTSVNNQALPDMSIGANSITSNNKLNAGGTLTTNQLTAADITRDLFNNRVTGPVPDGIPPGEKLKIDSLYPDVSGENAERKPSFKEEVTSATPTDMSISTPVLAGSESTTFVDNNLNLNEQGTSNSPSLDTTVGKSESKENNEFTSVLNANSNDAISNLNQNLQSGISPSQNTGVDANNRPGGNKPGTALTDQMGRNGPLVNNINNGQPSMGNAVPTNSWQGQINTAISNQPANTNPLGAGRQQVFNNQIIQNGLPVQGMPLNNMNTFQTAANIKNQNRINSFQNGVVIAPNGQLIQRGMNNNNIPNRFNNFQNRFNSGGMAMAIPGSGNTIFTGANDGQFNNLQSNGGGIAQSSFNENINGRFRVISGGVNTQTGNMNNPIRDNRMFVGSQNTRFDSQNRMPGIQNAGNGVFNSGQIPQNNFGQQNVLQNVVMNNQFNGKTAQNTDVSRASMNGDRVNPIVNQAIRNTASDPNSIAANRGKNVNQMIPSSYDRVLNNVLNSSPTANNIAPGNIPNSVNNNFNKAINTGTSNTIVPEINRKFENNNQAVPVNNADASQNVQSLQTSFRKNMINLNYPILPSNGENLQTRNSLGKGNVQDRTNINNALFPQSISANILNERNGQLPNINTPPDNQATVFVGPNGQLVNTRSTLTNEQITTNRQATNNGRAATGDNQQQNGLIIPPTGSAIPSAGNTFSNVRNNQNLNPVNQIGLQIPNTNLQQMAGAGIVQNVPNMQVRNTLGPNGLVNRQKPPQNLFPNAAFNVMQQNGGFPNGFPISIGGRIVQDIPFGQNTPFISGPVNNFQNSFVNGPPGNIPGQLINRFPNDMGQFRPG